MKKIVLSILVCGILLVALAGVGNAAIIWSPGADIAGFPDSQMLFFDDWDWGGTPGTHAVVTVDYQDNWLYGAELDSYGVPTVFYVYDLLYDSLYIGVYDAYSGQIYWQ